MTKKEMVKWLRDEVTMSGSISLELTDAEFNRVIDKETNMIYELYPEAINYDFVIIHRNVFYQPEFRKNRIIQFPECVLSVIKFEEMRRRNSMFGIADPDFGFNRLF
jgi:hypothetical protein